MSQSQLDWDGLTRVPRRYGFDGTLKPPFALRGGVDRAALEEAVAGFARGTAPVTLRPLILRRLGRFLALVPDPDDENTRVLSSLAGRCVMELDRFRLPAGAADLAKRRAKGLTPRQDELLETWGYPYVLDEFRFHLTLTGSIKTATDLAAAETLLDELTQPFRQQPFEIYELCLFGDPGNGEGFRILNRFRLGS